jgi:hypothetical protein
MMRISIPWLVEVVENVDALDSVQANRTVSQEIGPLFRARNSVHTVFDQSIYGNYLRASRDTANALYITLDNLLSGDDWGNKKLSEYAVQGLRLQKERFKTVFLADLSVVPSYLVTRKENFDTAFLIEDGISLFPPALKIKAPETRHDAQEVGRALAFELPTACGFHVFRVTESVVRRYWDTVSNGADRPKSETLGSFAREMEDRQFGDKKVVESIKQMTKLHRNPLIHPEVILTVEEAIGLIGMSRSVIAPMLQMLPDVPPTTGAPLDLTAFGESASPPS